MRLFSISLALVLIFPLLFSCGGTEKSRAFYSQGLEKYRARDFANAAFLFGQAEKKDGAFLPAVVMRGKSFFFLKRFPEARETFERALKKENSSATAIIWLARLDLMENKTLAASEARLKKIIERDDENVGAYILLGQIAERAGRLPQAVEYFELSLAFDQETAFARARLADIYQKLGLHDRSKKAGR